MIILAFTLIGIEALLIAHLYYLNRKLWQQFGQPWVENWQIYEEETKA